MANILDRFWHALAGRKDSLVRCLDEVAHRLEISHPATIADLQKAFNAVPNGVELNAIRLKVASDLRDSSKKVKSERHAKDDAFESHDQHASLAQSTLNEQLLNLEVTHSAIGDDLDAFFNKYGSADLGGWIPVFLKIIAEKIHCQEKAPFPYFDPKDSHELEVTLPDVCRLIMMADWGANNNHAANIRDLIKKEIASTTLPVYVVHLGDIYYSGTTSECTTFLHNWPLLRIA